MQNSATPLSARNLAGFIAASLAFLGLLCLVSERAGLAARGASKQPLPPNRDSIAQFPASPPPTAIEGVVPIRAGTEADANGVLDAASSPAAEANAPPDEQTDEAACHEASPAFLSLEAAAIFSEAIIRERFGVIQRQGKWIPTVGGGTNLVYITTGSIPPGRVGEPYEVGFHAESGSPPYRWSVSGRDLPEPLRLDSLTGILRGIPDQAIIESFFLDVTDSRGARDRAEYVLVFQPREGLGIATETLPAAFPGQPYAIQLQGTGGIPPYAWSAAGNLSGIGVLELDPLTGYLGGEIATTLPPLDAPLIIWLRDAQSCVSKELTLHVREGLSILGVPNSTVRETEHIELVFRATGGLEPYRWGLNGVLPSGLDFSTNGCCAGAPTQSGQYHVDVWVQDAIGETVFAPFALEVLPRADNAITGFHALLSRNRVALSWSLDATNTDLAVRIVRKSNGLAQSPADGQTIYHGRDTSCLDRDVGAGRHGYTAFLEAGGTLITSAAAPGLVATLPPVTDPFADRVVETRLLHPQAFRASDLPWVVLGPPRGTGLAWGSMDVVSLGAAVNQDGGASAPYGGSITLEFSDNEVWDGPGADFTVFENVFYVCDSDGTPDPETRFMEPAIVSVSQDGVSWREFPTDFSPRYDPVTGALNLRHPYCYNTGFAGVNPVMSNGLDPDPTDPAMSGGDSFDLADIGLEWIRYVRIQSTGSRWLMDRDGDTIIHNEESGASSLSNNKSGFDLDAVTAIWIQKVESQ